MQESEGAALPGGALPPLHVAPWRLTPCPLASPRAIDFTWGGIVLYVVVPKNMPWGRGAVGGVAVRHLLRVAPTVPLLV